MLTSFNLPSKNLSQEKQMAMMRNYLNQLKDETETELYDIKWDNLSKSLKDKFNQIDGDIVAANNNTEYLRANVITAEEISAEYIKTNTLIAGGYIKSQYLTANNIQAGILSASYIDSALIRTNDLIVNGKIKSSFLTADNILAGTLSADYIDVAAVTAGLVKASAVTADYIVGKFTSSNTAVFDRVNIGLVSSYESNLRFLMSNNTYAPVKFEATSTPHRYNLVIDLP